MLFKIDKLPIGKRLGLSFGAILFLMIVGTVAGSIHLWNQHLLLSKIINEDTRKFEIVSELRNLVFQEAIALRDSVILTDEGEIRERLKDLEESARAFKDIKRRLGAYYDEGDGSRFFWEVVETRHSMEPKVQEVIRRSLLNQDREAHRILTLEIMPLQVKLFTALNELWNLMKDRQRADITREKRTFLIVQTLQMLLGGLTLLLGVLFSVWITRSISRPLMQLTEKAGNLQKGIYNTTTVVRTDEIGVLAHAFEIAVKEIRERQEREKELQFQILNKEKLAAVGQLAAGIVHNLKNPLNGIIGLTRQLREEVPASAELCTDILAAGEEMERIIANILDKTRQEQMGGKRPVNLNKIITDGLTFLEAAPFFKHRVRKEITLDGSLPVIEGIYSDFSQSIANLVKNALDAMCNSEQKILRVSTRHDADFLYVEVEDTGEGIDDLHRECLFEPYFTTKPTAEDVRGNQSAGTGLGLYMMRLLLQKYGAEYEIRSTKGKGTSVTVRFPKQICMVLPDRPAL